MEYKSTLAMFLSLIYLLSSPLASSSSSSSPASFSFDAGPRHVDLLRVVVAVDSEAPPIAGDGGGAASRSYPLPHDVILDSHRLPSSSSSSGTTSRFEWIAGNHFHRFDPEDVVLKARWGPFEASASVNAEEDAADDDDAAAPLAQSNDDDNDNNNDSNSNKDNNNSNNGVHVTAHPVAHALRRDEPVLRVLFHATNRRRVSCYDHLGQTDDECRFDRRLCVVARAARTTEAEEEEEEKEEDVADGWLEMPTPTAAEEEEGILAGSCLIESGVGEPTGCLMQIVVPTNWWTIPTTAKTTTSTAKRSTRKADRLPPRRRALDVAEMRIRGIGEEEAVAEEEEENEDGEEGEENRRPESNAEESHVSLHYRAFYVDDPAECHERLAKETRKTGKDKSQQQQKQLQQQQRRRRDARLLASDVLRVPMTPAGADGTDDAPAESNDAVQIRAPFDTVYRGAILHVPVTVAVNNKDNNNKKDNDDPSLDYFVVKAKVKRGLRIVGAEISAEGDRLWRTTVRSRGRAGASITITFSRRRRRFRNNRSKRGGRGGRGSSSSSSSSFVNRLVVATVIFKADDRDFFTDDQVRIAWTIESGVTGGNNNNNARDSSATGGGSARRNSTQTVLRASRDSVQALVPVVKTRRLLNTALVDGNAVVEPMRVFAVAWTSVVQDISAKATCHSQSRDSLKVSPSCENVYLDGSETHGFSDVTVLAKYAHYLGYTTLAVWVPRLPLKIILSDDKLSQIRGWKVPRVDSDRNDVGGGGDRNYLNRRQERQQQQQPPSSSSTKTPCSLKYQQATMRVLARFLTDGAASLAPDADDADDDADVKWLLGDGSSSVDVTTRLRTDVRVADAQVVGVRKAETADEDHGLVLTGLSPGVSRIQVVSPFTGRILASADVEVMAFDRVDLIGTHVSVLTGLSLVAEQEQSHQGQQQYHQQQQQQYHQQPPMLAASLTSFHGFGAVGQKGVLEIRLLFSDGSAFPLGAVSPSDYSLLVNTIASDVVAISTVPPTTSAAAVEAAAATSTSVNFSSAKNKTHVPTLVATGEGSGDLIYVSLDSPDSCVGKRRQESSDPAQNFLLIPSLTSDYVPVTVGHGISPEYDVDYADDWLGGVDDFDGFLNDGSYTGYGGHWGLPLGADPGVKESSASDPSRGRSYAYQEFSKLGAVKESHNRKKFSDGEGFGVKSEKTFSAFADYDFDRWDSRRVQDPQDYFLPGVSEKRAAAPEESGFSKTEVALYVLLAVLALAVAVLAAHCAVHHVKRKSVVKVIAAHTSSLTKRVGGASSSSGGVAGADVDGESATEDASEDFSRADDFVWMSKEALEEAEIPVECTQRLMPDADFVAQTLRRDLPPHHPGQPAIASLSRGNSRSSYTGGRLPPPPPPPPPHGSLPVVAHHRGSLPECHRRSRTSSVASSGSRVSQRSAASSSVSRRHHSDSAAGGGGGGGGGAGVRASSSTEGTIIGVDDIHRCRFGDVVDIDDSSLRSASAVGSTVVRGVGGVGGRVDSGSIRNDRVEVDDDDDDDADSTRFNRSRASSLLSVTLNPMGDHLHHQHHPMASSSSSSAAAFERVVDPVDGIGGVMIPSSSSMASSSRGRVGSSTAASSLSSGGATSPIKSPVSTPMTAIRYSPAMSASPPSSPGLNGSPPASPVLLTRSCRPLLKQDSVASTNSTSTVLGSICYDYRERGLSFDQMVQYFDHLDETPA